MKTLIIGLGNPILGDDGIGWRVVEEVARQTVDRPEVETDCVSLGGLNLMERLTGYERVVLIDAIYTGSKPVGTVSRFVLSDLPDLTAGHSASAHDTSLRTALNVGRSMDIPLPKDEAVTVIAIEAENVYDFTQELSAAVAAAVPLATQSVLDALKD
jgi:hydrogenase maturation protease